MTSTAIARSDAEIRPNGFFSRGLAEVDPAVADAIAGELRREQHQIELIASENIVSKAVLEAQDRSSPTNTPRATQVGATTRVAPRPTRSRNWRSIAPSSCSAAASPTSSLTRVRRQTVL